MSNFFLRKAKLIVGDPTLGGLEIIDLRISFNVALSLVGFPSTATIQIYNLNKSNRNKIKEEFTKIFLYAGYEENVPLIFSGDLVNVTHEKNGPDWITNLFCGDAIRSINNSTVNKTLPPGATTESMFDELVGQMDGVTKGVTEGLKNCLTKKRSLLRSIVLSGNVKDWLDKLAQNCGFDYSINNDIIETTVKNKPLNDEPVIIIKQDNGMIGSPELTETGVKVKSLLIPQMKLGRQVEIQSISAKINIGNLIFRKVPATVGIGTYRADKINHVGDTRGNDWFTNIEARNF
jgi:Baseplate hub gp41